MTEIVTPNTRNTHSSAFLLARGERWAHGIGWNDANVIASMSQALQRFLLSSVDILCLEAAYSLRQVFHRIRWFCPRFSPIILTDARFTPFEAAACQPACVCVHQKALTLCQCHTFYISCVLQITSNKDNRKRTHCIG